MAVPAVLVLFLTCLAAGVVLALPLASLGETGPRFLRFGAALSAVLYAAAAGIRIGAHPAPFLSSIGSALAVAAASSLALVAVLASAGRAAAARHALWGPAVLSVAVLVELSLGIGVAGVGPFPLVLGQVITSAVLLGAVMVSLMLGHFYLVVPGLSIRPLRRESALFAASVAARGVFAAAMAIVTFGGAGADAGHRFMELSVFLLTRGLFGIVGPAIFAYMVWETVKIRSTQSATGILYVATALVLLGELSAGYLLLAHNLIL